MMNFESIPRELWIEILVRTDDLSLSGPVPRLSKHFHSLASDDSNIWKIKCAEKFNSDSKPDSLSWKQYYWTSGNYF